MYGIEAHLQSFIICFQSKQTKTNCGYLMMMVMMVTGFDRKLINRLRRGRNYYVTKYNEVKQELLYIRRYEQEVIKWL